MTLHVQFSYACQTRLFRISEAIMKTIAVFAALVAVALAAPQGPREIYIVNETPSNNIGLADGYEFGYQLSDGQSRQESAQVETRSAEESILRVRGSYSFVADDGQTYTITYIADENGFQPQGAHIPVVA